MLISPRWQSTRSASTASRDWTSSPDRVLSVFVLVCSVEEERYQGDLIAERADHRVVAFEVKYRGGAA
jgi:hypothetical protein